jgi:adenine-specific DNA-methyltransferase
MSGYISEKMISVSYKNAQNGWVVLSDIEQRIKDKVEKAGTPLKDWDISIYRGILTGYNEAFIIDGKKRQELIDKSPNSVDIIRPILRGRDIKKYGYDNNDLWLIFIPWHFPLQNDESITGVSEQAEQEFKIQFPAVYNHLLNYKKELSNRNKAETGIRYEWYALQRWGAQYWRDFNKPKIIYPEITKFINFHIDYTGFITNNKCFIVTGKNIEFLTAFLNSSLFKFCFKENFPELLGGSRELRKIFFEKIPIIKVNDETNESFNDLILKIQSLKILGVNTTEYEIKIDDLIFNLYGLSAEEKKIIGYIEIS